MSGCHSVLKCHYHVLFYPYIKPIDHNNVLGNTMELVLPRYAHTLNNHYILYGCNILPA